MTLSPDCCYKKKVGSYEYTLLAESAEETSEWGCQDDCVYCRDDQGPEKRYCFGQVMLDCDP